MAQRFDITVTVTQNRLPQLKANGKRKAGQAVRRAAFNTQRYAAPLTPVDTGALKANVIIDQAGDGLSATVKWGQFYAIFQEYGTSRGVSAKRFAQGGAEKAMPMFVRDMSNVYGGGA